MTDGFDTTNQWLKLILSVLIEIRDLLNKEEPK